ncbi:MAG TPA: murein biosynthesis integral membrane protein MurJ [Oligoflexus sp.]|uniref:murein biosynthesis integral membrane protein MurJ n=1 Tax=Oligoflexus sp. TaxID=1971216 RepID=UPI002D5E469F|nr:murein biosynthesis integral membrane protein MurJ [Oligoflexus sp.]HYX37475.1 murein biosynthesis integral membrane protein MurJ [Oligoflexus sp.]
MTQKPKASRSGALIVGAGILLSRMIGFLRERVIAHTLGASDAADVFRAALRIPNLLQNLFGEGAMSASFIPVYAGLHAKDPKEAARVAGVVGSMLALLTSILVLLGYLFTPQLVNLITPGFTGVKREAAITLVRILFPGIGLLVLSAFCLGVLNSHRRFFIPYAAPVLWSGAIIATAYFWQHPDAYNFAEHLAWGAVLGSFLQLAVQIPSLWPYLKGMKLSLHWRSEPVQTVITRFVPSLFSRGVVQISAFFESMIASFLRSGSIANLGYAQLLYTLPTSLFGASIAASKLVDMSMTDQRQEIGKDLSQGMRQLAFFIVPSSIAFLMLGHVLAAILFQTGKFTAEDGRRVWIILAASSIGLMASTQGRLLTTAFYALKNTRTPFHYSIVRVAVSIALAAFFSLLLPRFLPIPPDWATGGIGLASSVAGLVEFFLLRKALLQQVPFESLPAKYLGSLALSALTAGAIAYSVFHYASRLPLPIWISGGFSIASFGTLYLGLTLTFKVTESQSFYKKVRTRVPLPRKK